jgi:hypothetical protein
LLTSELACETMSESNTRTTLKTQLTGHQTKQMTELSNTTEGA